VAQNASVPLISQNSYADSSRAGQFYNSVGYLGVSSPYGTLTVFRQNSLTLDAVFAYDPMGASYAFSPIGFQGITCGVGDTEDCRFSTSVRYHVDIGQYRVAALWQFGGYSLNNAATGSYQLQLGGDIANLAGGTLSLAAIGSYVQNAVSIGLAGNTLPAVLPQVLTATLSDDSSVMLVAKYSNGPVKLFAAMAAWRKATLIATRSIPRLGFASASEKSTGGRTAGTVNSPLYRPAISRGFYRRFRRLSARRVKPGDARPSHQTSIVRFRSAMITIRIGRVRLCRHGPIESVEGVDRLPV
jgi:predicted porin